MYVCVYITNILFSSFSHVLSKAPQTKQQDTAVLYNVMRKPPQRQAHISLNTKIIGSLFASDGEDRLDKFRMSRNSFDTDCSMMRILSK